MPALQNPRHERYAQLIFTSLCNGEPKTYSQSYIEAGYRARDTDRTHRSAQASSSRLLSKVIHRVRELQELAARNAAESVEKMVQELNEIQMEARNDKAHAAAVSAIATKAKLLNLPNDQNTQNIDFKQARSMKMSDASCCSLSVFLSLMTHRSKQLSRRTMHLLSVLRRYAMQLKGLG
jgi:hypothetical protein